MEKTISLYEMTTDLIGLVEVEEIDEATKMQIIETIKEQMEAKAENIIAVIRNYEVSINAIREEEKRLAEYRRIKEKQLDKLKEYTISCMEQLGNKKLDTNLGRISLRKKPDTLSIVHEEKVPNKFKEEIITTTVKIDKNVIKKALKDGEEVEGVVVNVGGNSLVIK